MGFDFKTVRNRSGYFEVGLACSRQLNYQSGLPGSYYPNNTVLSARRVAIRAEANPRRWGFMPLARLLISHSPSGFGLRGFRPKMVVRLPAVVPDGDRRRANWCRILIRRPQFFSRPARATRRGERFARRAATSAGRAQRRVPKIAVRSHVAWPGGAGGMGDNDLELQGIFALPCPTIDRRW